MSDLDNELDVELDEGNEVLEQEADVEFDTVESEDDTSADLESETDTESDEDIFAFLEDEEEAESEEASTAEAVAEAKPDPEAKVSEGTQEEQPFPLEIVPGTDEYVARLTAEAEKILKEKYGEDVYDPICEPKHQAAFSILIRKLDQKAEQFYEEKKVEFETQKTVITAKANAESEIETILTTPELIAKFYDAMEDMPFRQRKALVAEAEKGNFTGFLDMAKRIAGIKAKVNSINNRAQEPVRPTRQAQREQTEIPDDDDGVAGMLGI